MKTHCGYIALVGSPNVGKSTLLNCILDIKLSITSHKPQTTRNRILGIRTEEQYQYIYVDTPGIHQNSKKTLNKMMNNSANYTISDVDVIVFLVENVLWNEQDEYVFSLIKNLSIPIVLVINKIDKIKDKTILLPWIDQIQQKHKFAQIIPLSAKTGNQVDNLHLLLKSYLPIGPHLFAEDQFTDRS